MTTAITAADVDGGSGFADDNFFGEAVRAQRREVRLLAMWTTKRVHAPFVRNEFAAKQFFCRDCRDIWMPLRDSLKQLFRRTDSMDA
jgi:hypothetical protein